MTRIPFETMQQVITEAFVRAGMNEHDALICARTHTESSCDGVYSSIGRSEKCGGSAVRSKRGYDPSG